MLIFKIKIKIKNENKNIPLCIERKCEKVGSMNVFKHTNKSLENYMFLLLIKVLIPILGHEQLMWSIDIHFF